MDRTPHQSHERARSEGRVPQDHGHGLGGHLQYAPRARLECRARAGTQAPAGAHSIEPSFDGEPPAAPLAQEPAGPGGVAHPQLQPSDVRGREHAFAARALRHHSHRLRGLSAAFLDRATPGAALHLRNPQGGGAGARPRLRRGVCAPHLGDDHPSGFLRGRHDRSSHGASEARPRSGPSDGPRDVRWTWLAGDAEHRQAPG